MATYNCEGFRAVEAGSPGEAAEIFGTRLARKQYGKRGYVRTKRLDSWSEDHRYHTYQIFIGYTPRGQYGTTEGHNEWLQVRG